MLQIESVTLVNYYNCIVPEWTHPCIHLLFLPIVRSFLFSAQRSFWLFLHTYVHMTVHLSIHCQFVCLCVCQMGMFEYDFYEYCQTCIDRGPVTFYYLFFVYIKYSHIAPNTIKTCCWLDYKIYLSHHIRDSFLRISKWIIKRLKLVLILLFLFWYS